MGQTITITSYTGSTPVDVYVADTYGNNRVFVETLNSAVPPSVTYNLPSQYSAVPMVSVILVENNGCETILKTNCQI
jgi:hypothetical protein